MLLLLMLVSLGVVFIQSSEALRCYVCGVKQWGHSCDEPPLEKDCDTGNDICVKSVTPIYGIRLLFYSDCSIKLS